MEKRSLSPSETCWAQAPAKQSACSSVITEGSENCERAWMTWPHSWATTTATVKSPNCSPIGGHEVRLVPHHRILGGAVEGVVQQLADVGARRAGHAAGIGAAVDREQAARERFVVLAVGLGELRRSTTTRGRRRRCRSGRWCRCRRRPGCRRQRAAARRRAGAGGAGGGLLDLGADDVAVLGRGVEAAGGDLRPACTPQALRASSAASTTARRRR